jgi:hypothetical protein
MACLGLLAFLSFHILSFTNFLLPLHPIHAN